MHNVGGDFVEPTFLFVIPIKMLINSADKRKHKTLTLFTKLEIINRIENGERLEELSLQYGVGRSTIYDIKKNREKIRAFIEGNSAGGRQTLKFGEYPQVEQALYSWYLEERGQTPLSGDILRQKARTLYQEIMKRDDFKASNGWLDNFKRRYGIRFVGKPEEDDVFCHPFVTSELKEDPLSLISSEYEEKASVVTGSSEESGSIGNVQSRVSDDVGSVDKETTTSSCVHEEVGFHEYIKSGEEDNEQLFAHEAWEPEQNRSGDGQHQSTFTSRVGHDEALRAFDTCFQWAKENNIDAEDILVLQRLQERVVRAALKLETENY